MRSLLYSILSRLKTLDPETFKNNDTVKITFESLEQYPTRTINHPKRDEFIEASKALHSFRRKKIAFQGAVAAFGIWSMWGAFDPVGLMMLGTMGLIAIMTTKQLVLEGLGIWHRKKYLERATTLKQELDSEITPLFLGHDPRKSME